MNDGLASARTEQMAESVDDVRPGRRSLYLRGDAYGWLGFWIALGLIFATSIAVHAWNDINTQRTLIECARYDLHGGVCGK